MTANALYHSPLDKYLLLLLLLLVVVL